MPPFVRGGPNPSTANKEYKEELKEWAREQSVLANQKKEAMATAAAAAPAPRPESQEAAARRIVNERDMKKASLRQAEERSAVLQFGYNREENLRLGTALEKNRSRNLIFKRPEEMVGTGLRLVDMGAMQAEFISQKACSKCGHKGTLVASAGLEEWHGQIGRAHV